MVILEELFSLVFEENTDNEKKRWLRFSGVDYIIKRYRAHETFT